jgi:hypothetical protein
MNHSRGEIDGVVEIVGAARTAGAARHFDSLAAGQTETLSFPRLADRASIRVRWGDRVMHTLEIPLRGRG